MLFKDFVPPRVHTSSSRSVKVRRIVSGAVQVHMRQVPAFPACGWPSDFQRSSKSDWPPHCMSSRLHRCRLALHANHPDCNLLRAKRGQGGSEISTVEATLKSGGEGEATCQDEKLLLGTTALLHAYGTKNLSLRVHFHVSCLSDHTDAQIQEPMRVAGVRDARKASCPTLAHPTHRRVEMHCVQA